MSDNSNAASRIAELLERIATALEKTAVSDHAERTEESKERQETLEKTIKPKREDHDSGAFTELQKKISPFIAEGVSPVSMMAKGLQSLTDSRQAQAGLVGPADSVMGEISQLSSAGVYLSDKDMETYGSYIATNQQAMQHNMKLLRQHTNRGTWNNIMDRWGEWKLDVDDDISTKGTWGAIKGWIGNLFSGGGGDGIPPAKQNHTMQGLQRNQGLDSFGRY